MEKLKHFFWLCSGAHLAILRKCESEASKYVGIGATVFFTGLFAALAASYALYTVFDNYWIATVLGLVWGFMIFNLDRYIVSSMRKEGNVRRELLTALPRIILAVIISLVIAKPLEMKIFEKEIQAELVMMEQQMLAAQESETKLRFQSDRERLNGEIESLKKEITDKTTTRDELDPLAREEADGTGGSKRRNAGPIYKLKKADADRASLELQQLEQRNNQLIQEKLAMLDKTDSSIAAELATLERLKSDPTVIADLPEKLESKEFSHLTTEQASLYESCVRRMMNQIDNIQGIQRRGVVLAALIKLKQICNQPSQRLKDRAEGASADPARSGKCIRLLAMLDEVLAEGDQSLIFTQFRQMGNLLHAMIRKRFDREVLFLHGQNTLPQRHGHGGEFSEGKGPGADSLSEGRWSRFEPDRRDACL